MVRDDRNCPAIAVVRRVQLDAVEPAGHLQRGQRRNETHPEAGANRLKRYVVGAAVGDDAARRQDALVPLLDTERVLGTEIELDGAVEHAPGVFRRVVQVLYGGKSYGFWEPQRRKGPRRSAPGGSRRSIGRPS